MNYSGNVPMGADTPSAPWNTTPIPERNFGVLCSQTLSKSVSVATDNYVPEYTQDSTADTSDTDWEEEYHDNNHYTPIQLIKLFKNHLELELTRYGDAVNKKRYEHLIQECNDWIEDETEYIKE